MLLRNILYSHVHRFVALVMTFYQPMYFLPKALAPGRENLVFAPFGLATNIAMLLEAANGDTAKEILKAVNISPNSIPDLRTGFKAYCDTFEVSDCTKHTFFSSESSTFSNLEFWSLC